MNTEQIEVLKALAEAATPGKRKLCAVVDRSIKHLCPVDQEGLSMLTVVHDDGVPFAAVYKDEDAHFFAACDSETILSLIASATASEGRIAELEAALRSLAEGADAAGWVCNTGMMDSRIEVARAALAGSATPSNPVAHEPNPFSPPDRWTLLLTGDNNGCVGKLGEAFKGSPSHYDRVDVQRIGSDTLKNADSERMFANAPDFGPLYSTRLNAKRYEFLRAQHESDKANAFCVFKDDASAESLDAIGSMPGELDQTIDAAIAAMAAKGGAA